MILNKKIKKIIIIIALILFATSGLMQSFAFNIGSKELVSLGECERLLTCNGIPVKTTYIVYEKDGIRYPAYCLDVSLPGAEEGPYSVNGGSKIQDVNVWRAVINGYPYKSLNELGAANEQEAFTATKQAVYTMLYNRDTSLYGAVDSESGRRTYQIYLNIVNNARNSTETIINNPTAQINSENKEWKIDNLNNKYVSKTFNIISNFNIGSSKVELEGKIPEGTIITDLNNKAKNTFSIGEKFKILLPIDKLDKEDVFKIKCISNFETKPVVYGSSTIAGKQDYALTGYMYEESTSTIEENYFKNITKLIVVKKEYGNEKRLEGVKFELLDADKNVVKKELATDKNGEIILENMIPGKYYLKETNTLENYNLYTDLIEINLDLNEEFTVTVNNSLKEITEIDKEFESLEITPKYENTIYNVNTIKAESNVNIIKKLPVTGY